MVSESEFKVNEFLSLKSEENSINIYVSGKKFPQSQLLSYNIPLVDFFDRFKSIDEAYEKIDKESVSNQFQDQCLSLQEWAKNKYDTRLLHRAIAFPLLKKLVQVGDPVAKQVFKKEIEKKFSSDHIPSIIYLIQAGYLKIFNKEEISNLYDQVSFAEEDGTQDSKDFVSNMEKLGKLGVKPAIKVLEGIKDSSEEGKFIALSTNLKTKLGNSGLKFKSLISTLNLIELKKICKEHKITGYSRYTKGELIEKISTSLSQEELSKVSIQCEKKILSKVIEQAISVINGQEREKISDITITNTETHEVTIKFEGVKREIITSLAINAQSIINPPRGCNCRVGGNLGFCVHFWIVF
ncbi:MAG: Rho termination factor N-terminal domain-containing protein, partial [Promethearchaeota archaeon]